MKTTNISFSKTILEVRMVGKMIEVNFGLVILEMTLREWESLKSKVWVAVDMYQRKVAEKEIMEVR